jgi:hypothetical protein
MGERPEMGLPKRVEIIEPPWSRGSIDVETSETGHRVRRAGRRGSVPGKIIDSLRPLFPNKIGSWEGRGRWSWIWRYSHTLQGRFWYWLLSSIFTLRFFTPEAERDF